MKNAITTLAIILCIGSAFGQERNDFNAYHRSLVYPQNQMDKEIIRPLHLKDKYEQNRPSEYLPEGIAALKYVMDSTLYSDFTGSWGKRYLERFTYNNSGQYITSKALENINGHWRPSQDEQVTYGPTGQTMQRILNYQWDTTHMAWDISVKYDYQYDANGNLIEVVTLQKDSAIAPWETSSKWTLMYDGSGKLTEEMVEYWDRINSQWENNSKNTYAYSGGRLTKLEYFRWDMSQALWQINRQTLYYPDANGYDTLAISSDWDPNTAMIHHSYKTHFKYNSTNKAIEGVEYYWNYALAQWVKSYREKYQYDGQGNPMQLIFEMWDEALAIWIKQGKDVYNFDPAVPATDVAMPYFYQGYFTSLINSMQFFTWDANSSQWSVSDTVAFYYSQRNFTSLNEAEYLGINLYPNPAHNQLNYELEDTNEKILVKIYDAMGRLVLAGQGSGTKPINIAALPNGKYTVSIIQGGKVYSAVFLKQ